nr:MAG TPA_asm: hypothetical protein [Caudoviricetes sp.]
MFAIIQHPLSFLPVHCVQFVSLCSYKKPIQDFSDFRQKV